MRTPSSHQTRRAWVPATAALVSARPAAPALHNQEPRARPPEDVEIPTPASRARPGQAVQARPVLPHRPVSLFPTQPAPAPWGAGPPAPCSSAQPLGGTAWTLLQGSGSQGGRVVLRSQRSPLQKGSAPPNPLHSPKHLGLDPPSPESPPPCVPHSCLLGAGRREEPPTASPGKGLRPGHRSLPQPRGVRNTGPG